MPSKMDRRKTVDIIVCALWWLTVSIVFPYQARKRGLIRRRWVRILLTFISPAALLTYGIIWFGIEIGRGPGFDPEQAPFRTREEIVALTGLADLPDFSREKYYYDWWEGWTRVRYSFSKPLPDEVRKALEDLCSEKDNPYWTLEEPTDTAFYGISKYVFSRGWLSEVIDKPDDILPDDMHVTISFGDNGFDIVFHHQGMFHLDGWSSAEQVSGNTRVDFPDFEIVDYEWTDHFPDVAATMTIRFKQHPDRRFLRQLEASDGWHEEDDGYSFRTSFDETTRTGYSIHVSKESRIARMWFNSY